MLLPAAQTCLQLPQSVPVVSSARRSVAVRKESRIRPLRKPPTCRRPARVTVKRIALIPSIRSLIANRFLRWLCRSPPLDLFEPSGLMRLRRQVGALDRISGLFGFACAERFVWHRASTRGVRTRVLRTPGADPAQRGPVLLYLHGGAFLLRALNGHMNVAMGLARAAGLSRAVMPIYRLAPEYPFPAAVDDCVGVYRGLLDSGLSGEQIVLAGDSAGGGLVLKLLMRLRDCGLPLPACGVLLSPFTDLTCSGHSMSANAGVDPMFGCLPRMEVRFYLGASNARDPGCSPLFGNFSGLPPLLAQVGSTERLLDDSLRLAPKVERAGG